MILNNPLGGAIRDPLPSLASEKKCIRDTYRIRHTRFCDTYRMNSSLGVFVPALVNSHQSIMADIGSIVEKLDSCWSEQVCQGVKCSVWRFEVLSFLQSCALVAVAKRKSIFDDRPQEIQQLTFIVKQDIGQLNKQIAQLQEVGCHYRGTAFFGFK